MKIRPIGAELFLAARQTDVQPDMTKLIVALRSSVDTPTNCILLTQCICLFLTENCAGGKIEKNEMGGACGAYGGGERGAQGSGGET